MTEVRAITPADRSRWSELFVAYGLFYETPLGPRVVDGVWQWLLDPGHEIEGLVAVDNGSRVIGFALFREYADTFTAGRSIHLDDLFVDPESRRSGAATALIEGVSAVARVRGVGLIRWITAEDNNTARRVYDRLARKAPWVTYELKPR